MYFKVMKIYEYMMTIKTRKGSDTLLELAAAAVKYAEKYTPFRVGLVWASCRLNRH